MAEKYIILMIPRARGPLEPKNTIHGNLSTVSTGIASEWEKPRCEAQGHTSP